jgi:hypothetical protein
VPGCEGAKVMRTVQDALPGRVAGQLVVSVKSPVRPRVRVKGCAPELPMVTVWVVVEVLVTTTALGKVMEVGVRVRAGLTDWPVPVGWGRVVPVMRTDWPWASPSARARVVESAEGDWRDW